MLKNHYFWNKNLDISMTAGIFLQLEGNNDSIG